MHFQAASIFKTLIKHKDKYSYWLEIKDKRALWKQTGPPFLQTQHIYFESLICIKIKIAKRDGKWREILNRTTLFEGKVHDRIKQPVNIV